MALQNRGNIYEKKFDSSKRCNKDERKLKTIGKEIKDNMLTSRGWLKW